MSECKSTRKCPNCKEKKSLDKFYKKGKTQWCIECNRESCRAYATKRRKDQGYVSKNKKVTKEWYHKQKTNDEKYCRRQCLRYKYGLTIEKYEEMLKSQNGVCVICGQSEIRKKMGKLMPLCVDHDHSDNTIRDILCDNCNVGLGRFADSTERLMAAIRYLQSHNEKRDQQTDKISVELFGSNI